MTGPHARRTRAAIALSLASVVPLACSSDGGTTAEPTPTIDATEASDAADATGATEVTGTATAGTTATSETGSGGTATAPTAAPDTAAPGTAGTSGAPGDTSATVATSAATTGDVDEEAVAELVDAVDRTRASSSGRVTQDLELSVPMLGEVVLGVSATVPSFDGAAFATDISLEQSGTTITGEAISDGERGWVRFDAPEGTEPPAGIPLGTWVTGPVDELADAQLFEPLAETFAPLDLVHGATSVGEPEEVELDGRPLVRRAVEIDLERASAQVPAARREALDGVISLSGTEGPVLLVGDVWLDADGRLVAMDVSAEGTFGDEQGDYRARVSMDVSAIDEELELPAPPDPAEVEVVELSSL